MAPGERTPLINKSNSGCCGNSKSGTCCGGAGSRSTAVAESSLLTTTTGGAAVPLKRNKKDADAEPVWDLQRSPSRSSIRSNRRLQIEELLADQEPLASKCGVPNGQCCKDLKGEDERHLISPEVVRDVIIGLSDGLTVPFALTAGLASLGNPTLVVTGGLAELCAGAISMGLGGFLASQAELDHFHYLRKQTHARVLRSCDGEMEREVHAILGPLGVNEALSRLVAEDLRTVEDDVCGDAPGAEGVDEVVRDLESNTRKEDNLDQGLTAFLLKFGEGMEEVPRSRLWISALTIGLSYFIGGLIPLLPYVFASDAAVGLFWSAITTGIILLIFGSFKTYFTGATGGYGGYLYGSVSTLLVGGVAAGSAYALVKVMGVQE